MPHVIPHGGCARGHAESAGESGLGVVESHADVDEGDAPRFEMPDQRPLAVRLVDADEDEIQAFEELEPRRLHPQDVRNDPRWSLE